MEEVFAIKNKTASLNTNNKYLLEKHSATATAKNPSSKNAVMMSKKQKTSTKMPGMKTTSKAKKNSQEILAAVNFDSN